MVERVLNEARDRPAALYEILDDEVLWDIGALDIPDAGTTQRRGPAGVREFFRRWVGPFDGWGYEVGDVIDAGDSVVAHIHQWGRGKGSGAKVESRFWQMWKIRDGKLVHATHHSGKPMPSQPRGLGSRAPSCASREPCAPCRQPRR
jgi:ketosteroid isomerase-like protein